MELTAPVPGLTRGGGQGDRRGRLRPVESRRPHPSTGDLWERHGSSAYALALALLGNETAAAEAVLRAMADLARAEDVAEVGATRRRLARTIYRFGQDFSGPGAGADRLPPAMVWLTRLARLQRASLALCVYGGLTHREAAALLDVDPDVVAELITAGLREISRLAAAPCA